MCPTEPNGLSPAGKAHDADLTTETRPRGGVQAAGTLVRYVIVGTGESAPAAEQGPCGQTTKVTAPPAIAPPSVQLYGQAHVRVRHLRARLEEVKE